jgi:hypothetical protein
MFKFELNSKGIFQRDDLRSLWFLLALDSLSLLLTKTDYGFKVKQNKAVLHVISHLFYVDDLKFYASTEHQLNQLLSRTEAFPNDIKMSFGTDKCKTQCIRRDKYHFHGFQLEDAGTIESMQKGDTYKYLGFQ